MDVICKHFERKLKLHFLHPAVFAVIFLISYSGAAQVPAIRPSVDSLPPGKEKQHPFTTGYFPVGFFDVDLKTLIKYNNHEGFRFGIGGLTNEKLFETVKTGGHVAYGLMDREVKYSAGGQVRIDKEKKTWIGGFYTKDIREIGSYDFLTDARVYSLFEPRLVNIIHFYNYRKWHTNIISELTPKIVSEFRISSINIENPEDYQFILDGKPYLNYKLAEISLALRFSPKTVFTTNEEGLLEYYDGLPKISAQITRGFKNIIGSDFSYLQLGLKLDYHLKHPGNSATDILMEGLVGYGELPLTQLFHAFPNQPNKTTVLKRFSVAGIQSFETMYFGEFFSDKLTTLQVKHYFKPFRLSPKWKPQVALISRHALGTLSFRERHQGIEFTTLDQLYNEASIELNKIFFGFGLSYSYRYGYYHLPDFSDNISFKFTFYLKI